MEPRQLADDVQEVFSRFNYRSDIERGLRELGFEQTFDSDEYKDDYVWTYGDDLEVLLFVTWISGEAKLFTNYHDISMHI